MSVARNHRLLVLLLTLSLALVSMAQAAAPKIVRVWAGHRTADEGERLVEFFGKPEPTGERTILRSQWDQRAGFFFLVRLEAPGLPAEAKLWRVRYLIPGSPKLRTKEFALNGLAGKKVFELGLTGIDWLDPKAQPTAWHIALVGAQGEVLVSEQSFLWSDRAAK